MCSSDLEGAYGGADVRRGADAPLDEGQHHPDLDGAARGASAEDEHVAGVRKLVHLASSAGADLRVHRDLHIGSVRPDLKDRGGIGGVVGAVLPGRYAGDDPF